MWIHRFAQFILLILTALAISQIPPKAECPTDPELTCTCPPGKDGESFEGEAGRAGLDCLLVELPNKQFGCYGRYDMGSFTPQDLLGRLVSRIDQKRFWFIVMICAVVPPVVFNEVF